MASAMNVGFISTRFAGTDGVSLEARKWAHVLSEEGHCCFWYAGRLDHGAECSYCVPEAFFGHPENEWINAHIWNRSSRPRAITRRIHTLAEYLKGTLYEFVERFNINLLVLQNVLAIPMHLPLGIAITQFLGENRIPAIAHHHDFYWERTRFAVSGVQDYLDMSFPPRNQDLHHVVINQTAQEELAHRKGVPAMVIPNVLDFDHPPAPADIYTADLRAELGLAPEDRIILQPTRVIPRKGIGHAINLVQMLGNPRYKLVITHEAGDEGLEYRDMLAEFARRSGVDVRFIATRITETRQVNHDGRKTYTLWDIYPYADFVTYPSLYEGFGNAFLEAVYFRKPILVNRYGVFTRDIEPRGFQVPIIDGYLPQEAVMEVRRILENSEYRERMVAHNYRVAARYYGYSTLRHGLQSLLYNVRGMDRHATGSK